MKSKESPNLYEILKGATSDNRASVPETVSPRPVTRIVAPPVVDEPAPDPVEKPEIQSPPTPPRIIVPATPVVPPATRVEEPNPPLKTETHPGERVLRLTMNNAIFAGLLGLGLLFAAYALGVRSGRHRAIEELNATEEKQSDSDPSSMGEAPAAPGKIWTIRLQEWPAQTPQERLKAMEKASGLETSLGRGGYKSAWHASVKRGEASKLVLFWGKFDDRNSSEAREKLAAIRQFKLQNQPAFTQAAFEEVDAP